MLAQNACSKQTWLRSTLQEYMLLPWHLVCCVRTHIKAFTPCACLAFWFLSSWTTSHTMQAI